MNSIRGCSSVIPPLQRLPTPARRSCWWATPGWARRGWAGGWRMASSRNMRPRTASSSGCWNSSAQKRRDGTECEAVLWDLAGQPDYRLIHALFLDDADLALVLFDPTRNDDPLAGVEFWLKQFGGQVAGPHRAGPAERGPPVPHHPRRRPQRPRRRRG